MIGKVIVFIICCLLVWNLLIPEEYQAKIKAKFDSVLVVDEDNQPAMYPGKPVEMKPAPKYGTFSED